MSGEYHDNFGVLFNSLLQKIEVVRRKRTELNKHVKEYISGFQMIETELVDSFLTARELCNKRWKYCNKKIKTLKKKKIEYESILDNLIEETQILQNPSTNSKDLQQIESVKSSLKQIDYKIHNLEKRIKSELLNITEENQIIENISKLNKKKKALIIELQKCELVKTQRKIEFIDAKLKNNFEQLNKWATKRRCCHEILLDLFQKVYKLKDNKKKMERELKDNKRAVERHFNQFSTILYFEKALAKKLRNNTAKQEDMPWLRLRFQNKEMFKKLRQEKLAIALEKQKAGKKLDFFEYRLILDQSEK